MSKVKAGLILGAYILYRLQGGPRIIDKLKDQAVRFIGNYIPRPIGKPITISLNEKEFTII